MWNSKYPKQNIVKTVCDGGLANESLFAIIMCAYKQMDNNGSVISAVTHLTDWNRMSSFTSPHTFKDANNADIKFIDTELDKNKYAMFIRKMAPEFPDDILRNYISMYVLAFSNVITCDVYVTQICFLYIRPSDIRSQFKF